MIFWKKMSEIKKQISRGYGLENFTFFQKKLKKKNYDLKIKFRLELFLILKFF
jgi:hypothetical protein